MVVENRQHERLQRKEKLFIEVLAASGGETEDNLLVECTTQDISVSGMKIHSKYPLIVNSILELLVNFETGDYKFLLTGEVKWLKPLENEEYLAGFEIIHSEHSDYLVWQNMFSE